MLSLPEKFEEFSEARRNGFMKAKELKESGGRLAGVFCTYTPLEIFDAANVIIFVEINKFFFKKIKKIIGVR